MRRLVRSVGVGMSMLVAMCAVAAGDVQSGAASVESVWQGLRTLGLDDPESALHQWQSLGATLDVHRDPAEYRSAWLLRGLIEVDGWPERRPDVAITALDQAGQLDKDVDVDFNAASALLQQYSQFRHKGERAVFSRLRQSLQVFAAECGLGESDPYPATLASSGGACLPPIVFELRVALGRDLLLREMPRDSLIPLQAAYLQSTRSDAVIESATAALMLAQAMAQLDEPAAATYYLQQSTGGRTASASARHSVLAWLAESEVLARIDARDQAIVRARMAVEAAQQADLKRLQTRAILQLATLQQDDASVLGLQNALARSEQHGDTATLRALRGAMAVHAVTRGRYDEAEAQLHGVEAAFSDDGNPWDLLFILRRFEQALADRGEFRRAMAVLHKERELRIAISAETRAALLAEAEAQFESAERQRELEQLQAETRLQDERLRVTQLGKTISLLLLAILLLGVLFLWVWLIRLRRARSRLDGKRLELKQQAETDPLTGLYNRAYWNRYIATYRAPADHSDLLLLIDLDHFKRINDQFGHALGDQVLIETGRRLQRALRTGDLLVRWGGEEFLVLLHDVASSNAELVLRRLLGSISQLPFLVDRKPIRLSISVGACEVKPAQAVDERLLAQADRALYQAKQAGRNGAVLIGDGAGVDENGAESLVIIEG